MEIKNVKGVSHYLKQVFSEALHISILFKSQAAPKQMACARNFRDVDIEELDKKFQSIVSKELPAPEKKDNEKYAIIIDQILKQDRDYSDVNILKQVFRLHKFSHKNSFLFQVFQSIKVAKGYSKDDEVYLRHVLKIKAGKSQSGIISITVFTSGRPEWIDPVTGEIRTQDFTCKWNCHYCPNEPGQPRSYLKLEPGVLRANRNNFDCVQQMHDRMKSLSLIGHEIDKLEVLVLGGTFVSYPQAYREQFIRDIYYAANTFGNDIANREERLTLDEEKSINKTSSCKVIGLTIETRPDTITAKELKLLRYYGCTRVQLGIQHIDDDVLKTINRCCATSRTMKGIKLLKNAGYKIDGHWMPNLPGSSIEKDRNMFINQLLGTEEQTKELLEDGSQYIKYSLTNPHIQVDQWKVYPCTLVPYTEIENMYKRGEYVPYEMNVLEELLIDIKSKVFPFIRLNRVVRDIPDDYSFLTDYKGNMRQEILDKMKLKGLVCNCIRCREVKDAKMKEADMVLVVREYNASDGTEYFISFESKDNRILYGFVRLRLSTEQAVDIFPELEGCSLLRELHVYGNLQPVNGSSANHVQHKGLGKRLVAHAETIARQNNYKKMSVIAGEGTRGYYEKLGYSDEQGQGYFMTKCI